MSLDASILKRLAALRLRPAAMAEVLSIIADVQSDSVTEIKTIKQLKNAEYYRRNRLKTTENSVAHPSPIEGPPDPLKNNPSPIPHHESKRARVRGTHLPEDWEPSESLHAYGVGQGMTAREVTHSLESFKLWARANRNRAVASKADWEQTAQNWLRREAPRNRAGPAGRSNGTEGFLENVQTMMEENENSKRGNGGAHQAVLNLPASERERD